MKQIYTYLVLLAVVMIAACNGGSSSSPSQTATTTTAPMEANVTLEVLGTSTSDNGHSVSVAFRLEESAGMGCNINFIRLEAYRPNGMFEERQELGADQVINQTGTNRLEANETRDPTVVFAFRAIIEKGRKLMFWVNMTDDRGSTHYPWEQFIFS